MNKSQTAVAELATAIKLLDNASDNDERFTAEVLVNQRAEEMGQ